MMRLRLLRQCAHGPAHQRLQSTMSVSASEAIRAAASEAAPAAQSTHFEPAMVKTLVGEGSILGKPNITIPKGPFERNFPMAKSVLWTTEATVVACVGIGAYAAYFISGWKATDPMPAGVPDNYVEKQAEATTSTSITSKRASAEDVSAFKAKTDSLFKR